MSYFVDFLLLHTAFYLIYKLLLSKETQLGLLRMFLLVTTGFSLLTPLINIPTGAPVFTMDLTTYVLPVFEVSAHSSSSVPSWEPGTLVSVVFGVVSLFFAMRLFIGLFKIRAYYQASEQCEIAGLSVRKLQGLQNSFTFMRVIFIDPMHFSSVASVVQHEYGHARKLHSLDVLLYQCLTVCFWWVPTVWLTQKELKLLHEYEADDFALQTTTNSTYIKTLVHSTLHAHGMNLASSFDDAPIFQRLNFMKKMKKNVSAWKVASLMALTMLVIVPFACDPQKEAEDVSLVQPIETDSAEGEVFAKVDESASFIGGFEAYASFLKDNLQYPTQAKELGVEGRVYVQFIVEPDGSVSNAEVVKGIGAGCDAEALRVVKMSPKWNPGKIQGEAVRQKYIQNIQFKL